MSHLASSRRGVRLAAVAFAAALCPTAALAAAQQRDDGGAPPMPRAWVLARTCGHLGSDCAAAQRRRLRVRVAPARAAAGRRTVFRLRVDRRSAGGRRPVRALVSFGGRRIRTDRRGRALVVARPLRSGRLAAIATTASSASAPAWVRVIG